MTYNKITIYSNQDSLLILLILTKLKKLKSAFRESTILNYLKLVIR